MKKIQLTLALLLLTWVSWAQIVDPVKWSHQATVQGGNLVVTFTAAIESGFHLYSMNLPEDGPQQTDFSFETLNGVEKNSAVKLLDGKELRHYDPNFGMELAYYERKATFCQTFRLTGGDYKVEGYVLFMSCNDEQCTPPTQYEFCIQGSADGAGEVVSSSRWPIWPTAGASWTVRCSSPSGSSSSSSWVSTCWASSACRTTTTRNPQTASRSPV